MLNDSLGKLKKKKVHGHCYGHSLKLKMNTRETQACEIVQELAISERTLTGHAKHSAVNVEDTLKCVQQGNSLKNQ